MKVLGKSFERIEEVPEECDKDYERGLDHIYEEIGRMVKEKKAREECNHSLRGKAS